MQDLQQEPARDLVDEPVERFGVVGHPAHEHADRLAVVVIDRELLQLLDHLAAQIGRHGGADPVGQDALEGVDQGQHQTGAGQAADDGEQGGH